MFMLNEKETNTSARGVIQINLIQKEGKFINVTPLAFLL